MWLIEKTDAMLCISCDVWLSHYTGFHSFGASCISKTLYHNHCNEIILSLLCSFTQQISFCVAVNSKFEYRNVSGYKIFMDQKTNFVFYYEGTLMYVLYSSSFNEICAVK